MTSMRSSDSSCKLLQGHRLTGSCGGRLPRFFLSGGLFPMRTILIRSVLALAVLLSAAAVPALAQSVTRGKVVDAQGKPVPDAVILFEAQGVNRKTQTKTDRNGDFLQVGLASGEYKVTASKDGVGSQSLPARVSQGQNPPISFTLAPAAAPGTGLGAADKEAAMKLQAMA